MAGSSPSHRPASRVVLANAGAGSTETEAVNAAVARLATDAPVELVWTEDPEDFVSTVRDLDDDRGLVVAGGDGSIHLALETVTDLDRTGRPVGIIPLGTGNDFARNHDIPLDPVAAADVVTAGNPVGVDAMRLESSAGDDEPTVVANNIHVGLGVRAAETASHLKTTLARFAYPVATAYQGVSGDPLRLTVIVDDRQVWDGDLLAVLVLLGPSMGGGVEMTPPDQTRLDVVLVEPAGPGERVELVRAALRGRIFDADKAERHRASRVVIGGVDGVDANVDGEMIGYAGTITLTHQPDAWQVLLPA